MFEGAKGKWVDELLGILQAYRTTSGKPIGATPFALTYEIEAVISTEVGMPIARTVMWKARNNNIDLEKHLDQANKGRETTTICIASYHQRVIAWYNKKAR